MRSLPPLPYDVQSKPLPPTPREDAHQPAQHRRDSDGSTSYSDFEDDNSADEHERRHNPFFAAAHDQSSERLARDGPGTGPSLEEQHAVDEQPEASFDSFGARREAVRQVSPTVTLDPHASDSIARMQAYHVDSRDRDSPGGRAHEHHVLNARPQETRPHDTHPQQTTRPAEEMKLSIAQEIKGIGPQVEEIFLNLANISGTYF